MSADRRQAERRFDNTYMPLTPYHQKEDVMSPFWKPTILVFAALILLGAMCVRKPAQSSAAGAAATTVVDPNEITRLAPPLSAIEVDAFQ
jgi:hypothetical protein